MIGPLKIAVLAIGAVVGWFLLASALLVFASPYFRIVLHGTSPWTAFWPVWWQNFHHAEKHISGALWMSGGCAAMAVALLLFVIVQLSRRTTRQPNLYGTSEFAGPQKMAAGGITTEKRS